MYRDSGPSDYGSHRHQLLDHGVGPLDSNIMSQETAPNPRLNPGPV